MKALIISFPQTWVLFKSAQWLWHCHLAHGTDRRPRAFPVYLSRPNYPPPSPTPASYTLWNPPTSGPSWLQHPSPNNHRIVSGLLKRLHTDLMPLVSAPLTSFPCSRQTGSSEMSVWLGHSWGQTSGFSKPLGQRFLDLNPKACEGCLPSDPQPNALLPFCFFWCCSVTKSCPSLCHSRDCSTSGFPVLHCLPELAQTHVHWVGDAMQPCHPQSPPSSPALNVSQHQGLFQWVGSSYQVAKVLEFQHQPLGNAWNLPKPLHPEVPS